MPKLLPFEQVREKHQEKIYQLILRRVGAPTEAEDLTQEVFINAYRSYEKFRGDCQISTWLCQIAINRCQNYQRIRTRRRNKDAYSLDQPIKTRDDHTFQGELPDKTALPQDYVLRQELKEKILTSIEDLPDMFREVVILCDLEQLSYSEIAKRTGMTEMTVKTRIHRGRLILRQRLTPYLQD